MKNKMMPNNPTTLRDGENCEHGVVKKYCFNCKFTEWQGMKVEMFNNHHYVRLKDVQSHSTELVRKIEGMKDKGATTMVGKLIYNQALDDVISLINQE